MSDHITTAAAITQYGLTRQQIKDGIESRALPAVNRAKPGSQRRHYRIYPSDLQAYARSLAGADS